MSIASSAFRWVNHSLPHYIRPSSIANATTSAAGLAKDAFSKTIGNATSTASAHPYVTTAIGLGLSVAAYRFLSNLRRPAAQAVRKFGRQNAVKVNPNGATGIKPNSAAQRRAARSTDTKPVVTETDSVKTQPVNVADPTKVQTKASTLKVPAYISTKSEHAENWAKLHKALLTNPKSIETIIVVHYQKSNRPHLLVRMQGYNRDKPETQDKLFSIDLVPTALPKNISINNVYEKDRSELGKLIGAAVPKDIDISYLPYPGM